jgi:secreted PhoX family phosphatase
MADRDGDPISNPSDNTTFDEIVAARVSRRSVLGGGLTAAAVAGAALGGVGSLLDSMPAAARGRRPSAGERKGRPRPRGLLGFEGIEVSSADTVVVPPGYTAEVLIAWGDPVSDGPAFEPDASNSAADQARQWGMHNDGLVYFPIHGSSRGLLVQNNEYTDDVLLFPDGKANWDAEKTAKSLNAHGVSIVEVARRRGRWEVVRPSPYARRITGQTRIAIAGPAAGDPRLVTSADPKGRTVLGTINNCAMGYTPWGTYLACEENFNGYFPPQRHTDAARGPLRDQRRRRRLPVAHDGEAVPGRRRAERAQPLRLDHRDRPVPAPLDTREAHRARAAQARGRAGAGVP